MRSRPRLRPGPSYFRFKVRRITGRTSSHNPAN
jgi:hypothetical protein